MAKPKTVGTAAVAAYFNVTQKCVRGWVHSGKLRADRNVPGGPLIYRWADVKALRHPAAPITETRSAAA